MHLPADGPIITAFLRTTEISSEKETYNVYKPHEEIVYVGTKKKEPEESQEAEDSSKSGNNQTEDGKKKTSDTQKTDAAQKKKVTN